MCFCHFLAYLQPTKINRRTLLHFSSSIWFKYKIHLQCMYKTDYNIINLLIWNWASNYRERCKKTKTLEFVRTYAKMTKRKRKRKWILSSPKGLDVMRQSMYEPSTWCKPAMNVWDCSKTPSWKSYLLQNWTVPIWTVSSSPNLWTAEDLYPKEKTYQKARRKEEQGKAMGLM